jgi:fumarate hydratase class II
MRPIILNNVIHMARILGDASSKLCEYGIEGIRLDQDKIGKYVEESLMLVTALSPTIEYDKASKIAHYALDNYLSLREAAIKLRYVNLEDFDRIVNPKEMVGNPRKDLGVTS